MMRTMLIHAQHGWPSTILTNLWPYSLWMATDVLKATPNLKLKDGQTPLESLPADHTQVHKFLHDWLPLKGAKHTASPTNSPYCPAQQQVLCAPSASAMRRTSGTSLSVSTQRGNSASSDYRLTSMHIMHSTTLTHICCNSSGKASGQLDRTS